MTALALLAAGQAADLITFLLVSRVVGIGAELNPLAQAAYGAGGEAGVVAMKAAGAVALVLVGSRLLHRRGLLLTLAAVGVGAAYLNLGALL